MNSIPKPLKDLIDSFEDLPGIGPRSASRLAYFLLRAPDQISQNLSERLTQLKSNIKTCTQCFNYSESEVCSICDDTSRDNSIIMVVEDPLDVAAFERVGSFDGRYHVLGGVISPMKGIGPEEIRIKELLKRLGNLKPREVIVATNPSLEGESTAMYIKRELEKSSIETSVTRLARGLPTGADLEYADDTTLRRALEGRNEY